MKAPMKNSMKNKTTAAADLAASKLVPARRGSILLIVIGLLTMVAMLGTTFLLVARMDSQQSRAIAQKDKADPIADGIVSKIQAQLVDNLQIGANGPFDAVNVGTKSGIQGGWQTFATYPSDAINPWLSSPNEVLAAPLAFFHPSLLPGSQLVGAAGAINADADGDTVNDSYWCRTGIATSTGDEYVYAVRVQDTSGWINVNTAASAAVGDLTTPICPVNVGLNGSLSTFPQLYNVRCGGNGVAPAPPTLATYNLQAALRLLTPVRTSTGYLPFGVGDEPFLRWAPHPNVPAAENPIRKYSPVAYGRLYKTLLGTPPNLPWNGGASTVVTRDVLTTWNSSTSILRQPALTGGNPTDPASLVARIPLLSANALDTPQAQTNLYNRLRAITGSRKAAGHLVANLWANLSPADRTKAFRFVVPKDIPADTDLAVFGVVEQLVIAEAYGRKITDSTDPLNIKTGWFYAIEIFNPSAVAIDLQDYSLKMGNDDRDLTTDVPTLLSSMAGMPANLGSGGRLVLYTIGGDVNGVPAKLTDFGMTVNTGCTWVKTDKLDKFDTTPAVLLRGAEGAAIPVDKMGISLTNDPDNSIDVARDDTPARDRALLGKERTEKSSTAPVANKLGEENERVDTEIDSMYGFGISLSHAQLRSLEELANVYFVGPEDDVAANKLEAFPQQVNSYATDISRGRPDFRGPVAANPNAVYPEVPWATLMGEVAEVVPPDATRELQSYPATRIYGRININTATKSVLMQLPWPDTIGAIDMKLNGRKETLVNFILAYRDRVVVKDGPGGTTIVDYTNAAAGTTLRNYADREPQAAGGPEFGTKIANLRRSSATWAGFLTPGEIAIPLADAMNHLMGLTDPTPATLTGSATVKDKAYLALRDKAYYNVANLVTVNSDTFVANLVVELRTPLGQTKQQWRYIALFDRSNCRKAGDQPAMLLYTEIK